MRAAAGKKLFAALVLMTAAAVRVQAQDATERETFYRVYQYETPEAGWFEPTLWTTHIPRSDGDYTHFGQTVGQAGLTAYSAELEYGVTDHLSLSAYADADDPHGMGPRFTRGRIEGRYHFRDSYDLPVNLAVYAEYYFPRKSYDGQQIELRLIAEKDWQDFRFDVNPTLEIATTGEEAGSAPHLGVDFGAYYRRWFHVQPGLEYYSNYGAIDSPAPAAAQQQVLFAVMDTRLGRNLDWQTGVGFGMTHASDAVVVKSILTYEFQGINPQRLFGHKGR